MYVFFLGLIPQGILPSQHRTTMPSVIASSKGSKVAKRLGDFLQTERGLRLFQSQGVRVHHPLFPQPPRVLPCEFIPGDRNLSEVDPPLRILTRHWLTGQAQGQAG